MIWRIVSSCTWCSGKTVKSFLLEDTENWGFIPHGTWITKYNLQKSFLQFKFLCFVLLSDAGLWQIHTFVRKNQTAMSLNNVWSGILNYCRFSILLDEKLILSNLILNVICIAGYMLLMSIATLSSQRSFSFMVSFNLLTWYATKKGCCWLSVNVFLVSSTFIFFSLIYFSVFTTC